jgi:hypothetical protein
MRFYMPLHTVFIITLLFFTAFSLASTDSNVREILQSGVCYLIIWPGIVLTMIQELSQPNRLEQQPIEASTRPLPVTKPEPTHVSTVVAELEAASDAVSAERPIAKMTAVVLVTGILFGLGMGL